MFYRALSRSGVMALVVALAAVLSVSAQAPKPAAESPQLMLATIVTLHQGAAAEYEKLMTDEVIPAQKKGGLELRRTWSSGVFGEGPMFATFPPVPSMARFDEPSPIVKGIGEDAAAALGQKTARLVAARRTLLIRTRPDLGIAGDMKAPPSPLTLVTDIQVAPGRRVEFEALIRKEIVPVMQQATVKAYSVLEVVYGDESGHYMTAVPYDSYDAIGKGHPLQIVLGEEGMKRLEAKFAGIITRLERHIARYRPDLSFATVKTTSH